MTALALRSRVLPRLRAWLFRQVWACRPGAGRQAVAALLAAGLGVALVLAVQVPALREEAATVQARSQDLQGRLAQARSRLQAVGQDLQPTSPAVPDAPRPAAASWQLQALARAAGLQVEQLRLAGQDPARPTRLELRLRGAYHRHVRFAAALARESLPLRLLGYRLQAGAGGMHLAELQLEQPAEPVSASAAEPAWLVRPLVDLAGLPDPFGEPAPEDPWAGLPALWRAELARPPELLQGAPLSAFEFTGTLRRGDEWLALLRWQGMVHTVKAGDYLGPPPGRVRRITEQGLWLRELRRDASGHWTEHERLWRVGETP